MPFALGLVVVGGTTALWASHGENRWFYALAKGIAAVGFVSVALTAGLPQTLAPRLLVVGLILAGAGDVALAFRSSVAFLAGMGAFALTHACYSVAFVARGVAAVPLVVAAIVVSTASAWVWRWLRPHLPPGMVVPIGVYVTLGSLMVTLAWASFGFGGPFVAAMGATAFYLSDLAVARERFVSHQTAEKVWGLPLYYLGQTLIALSAR